VEGTVIVLERKLLGYSLRAEAKGLDEGMEVLLLGGCRTHIGAVSVGEPDGTVQTLEFPGHKDQLLSEPWAAALAKALGERTCVLCGIHYDEATKEQIAQIVETAGEMLLELLERVTGR